MGVDIYWVAKVPGGHRFNANDLCKALEKALDSNPPTRVVVPTDGDLSFILIPSYHRWAQVSPEASAIARHIYVFKELSAIQEVLEDIPLYYGSDYMERPESGDTEYEALSVLAPHAVVDQDFVLTAQILSLEAEAKEKSDGA